jgi:hypothetical protein
MKGRVEAEEKQKRGRGQIRGKGATRRQRFGREEK